MTQFTAHDIEALRYWRGYAYARFTDTFNLTDRFGEWILKEQPTTPAVRSAFTRRILSVKNRTEYPALIDEMDKTLAKLEQSNQQNTHSPDFRSIRWKGVSYTFTEPQAHIIELLWKATENGTPDVSDAYLLTQADLKGKRLRDLFREHPAWGTAIVQGENRGTRRLAP